MQRRPSPSRSAAGRFLLLLALVPFAAPGLAQTNSPIPATFFGINPVHVADFPPLSFGTVGHPLFVWPSVEASRGVFDFTHLDGFVADAMGRGLYDPATNTVHMAITLGLTPSWALADTTGCTSHAATGPLSQYSCAPDDSTDWISLLTHLVDHYNGVTQPHLQYYELWNEANDAIWWTPPPGDTTFATLIGLARMAYPIIHRDPVSLLTTPSVAGKIDNQATWMSGYLRAGGAQYADVAVYHGYMGANGSSTFPMPEDEGGYGSTMTRVTRMRAVFDTCGLAGKPMLMTEGSWGNMNVTDPAIQVAWLARYMLIQAGLRSTTNLQMASWFCWADPAFGWGDLESKTGAPNAAGNAYSAVYSWVVGARIAAPFAGGSDGTWIGTLTRPGGYVAKVVWNTNGPATYTPLGPEYLLYRDLAGNSFPISPGAAVPIGIAPVLVEKGTYTNSVPSPSQAATRLRALPSVTPAASRILFGTPLGAPGRVEILDALGRVIRTLPVLAHSSSVVWDGEGPDGHVVADGVYLIRLVGPGTYSSGRVTVVH